jgi:DNA-binding NtrC family response regulator
MRASGNTTLPATGTSAERATHGGPAIVWLHPSSLSSPLEDGHTFGREAACGTVLAGKEVSRQHAVIQRNGPLPVLRDLESRNGVFVNGKKEGERPLGPGDVIRIGEWVGLVRELPSDVAAHGWGEVAPGLYGAATLRAALSEAEVAARTDLPIIVQGETGTGKEGVARAIHGWSGRCGPFVPVDCGALPTELAEGLLFGHRKGAFTGAERAHDGFIRAADGGTLFLDEILNLSLPVQAKLLRALEERRVVPLGEAHAVPVDLRIVCAAQEPLAEAAKARRFRPDLLARLDGLTVNLPPLRERKEDVVPLFREFLRSSGPAETVIDAKLVEALLLYDWPLNVREVVLLARRLRALRPNELALKRSMLPERMRLPRTDHAPTAVRPNRMPVDGAETLEALASAVREHGGSVARAATALGISRARAYRVLNAQRVASTARPAKDDK